MQAHKESRKRESRMRINSKTIIALPTDFHTRLVEEQLENRYPTQMDCFIAAADIGLMIMKARRNMVAQMMNNLEQNYTQQ